MPRCGAQLQSGATAANQVRIATELERKCDISKSAYATNSTTILYTVSAGKTLHLVAIALCFHNVSGLPREGAIAVRNVDDVIQYKMLTPRSTNNLSFCSPLSFPKAILIPEGWDIVISTLGAGASVDGFITGYEE